MRGFRKKVRFFLLPMRKAENTVDSFNKTCYSYIYTGKSRAVSCGASDSIILIGDEKDVLEKNERILLDASYDFFSEIGLTKEEIIREIGNGNEEAVIYAGLIAMSSILDNDSSSTRAITGNVYIDCALSVIGLDLATSVRTAIEKEFRKNCAATCKTSSQNNVRGYIWSCCYCWIVGPLCWRYRMMLSVLFKALFLMVAAEPGIATFKSMVRLYRQYKNKKSLM